MTATADLPADQPAGVGWAAASVVIDRAADVLLVDAGPDWLRGVPEEARSPLASWLLATAADTRIAGVTYRTRPALEFARLVLGEPKVTR